MDTGIVYGCLVPHPPVLVPAVGGRRAEQVRQTRESMERVAAEVRNISPQVIVLVSPHAPISHNAMSVCSADRYSGGFEAFGVARPRIEAEGDSELAVEIHRACRALKVPVTVMDRPRDTHDLDHGSAVPLFFLQRAGVDCRLVVLAFSGLSPSKHRQFGKAIEAAARTLGRRAVLVASGDLSHRLFLGAPAGYSPMGKQFDDLLVTALHRGDRDAVFEMDEGLREQAGECGYRSVVIAMGALPEARCEVLSYEGPFGVGYAVARFVVEAVSPEAETLPVLEPEERRAEAAVLELAKAAVEHYVRTGKAISLPEHPKGLLAESAGVFVSLKKDGELRGCIGTFRPTEPNIAREIVRNAIASASRDPRFRPVEPSELPHLTYSVDLLSPPEQVEDERRLDPIRYGVLVEAGGRRGLLLPDLEGVSTVRMQLEIAKRKAGIKEDEPVKIFSFTVRRISGS